MMSKEDTNSEQLSTSFINFTCSDSLVKDNDNVADTVSEGDGDAPLVVDSVTSDDGNEVKTEDQSLENGVSYEKEHLKTVDVPDDADYDSMLSMFDEYAANGKTLKVGHGYEVGDMVWGKVKSHPWWPGQIFSEAFATTSVRKAKREGHVLVAFFGDSSYGWFDPAELIPFELNFAEKSRQTVSKPFVKAVEDAVDELNRRHSLGLTCKCRNHYSFRPTNVEGYLAVDFGDTEGVYSVSQIKRARANFVPTGLLGFMKELALNPMNNEPRDIDFILSSATLLAYRKAVNENIDAAYSQAFGTQPARLAPDKASLDPSRVPLSGRLVFAEALGKRKTSTSSSKSKDEPEKNKYIFKRIDEPAGMSSHPSQMVGSDLPAKGLNDVLCASSHSTLPNAAEVVEASEDQTEADQFHALESVDHNPSEKHSSGAAEKKLCAEKTDGELEKAIIHKRPFSHSDSESFAAMEKAKKRKKYLARYPLLPGLSLEGKTNEDSQVNLALLHDLRALALNPFHGAESNCSAYAAQVFMRFRSLVYLKSPSNESREARLSMLASLPSSSDNNDNNNNNNSTEKPKATQPSLEALKRIASLEVSAKRGLKRGPSDHPELVAAKKKRIKDVKLLAAKKRVSEADDKVDGKDGNTNNEAGIMIAVQAVENNVSQKMSDIPRIDGKEVAAARKRVAPTPLARVVVVGLTGSEPGKKVELPAKAAASPTMLTRSEQEKKIELPAKAAPSPTMLTGSEPAKKKELSAKAAASPTMLTRSEPAKKKELLAKAAARPTMLVMRFPAEVSLPSSAELRAKFARFGSMDYKATRIFYASHTCRVTYNRKSDAQAALNFATSSNFGYMNVRCHLREVDSENPEAESTKFQVNYSHHIGGTLQSRDQLKSCLKRIPNEDEGVGIPGGGNGSGGKGRVKFMLGDGGGIADDLVASSHGLNYNTTDSFRVVPPTASSLQPTTIHVPSSQYTFPPNNFPQTIDIQPRNHLAVAPAPPPPPPNSDIRQPMLSLLCRCEGILKTLEGSFGYVPYNL